MTAITKTDDKVSMLDPMQSETYPGICGVTIARGQPVFYHATTGKLALSNAAVSGTAKCHGFALEAGGVNQTITILKKGRLAGFAASGNYGTDVFLNDTDGVIGDAAGTVSVKVGTVAPLSDNPAAPTKVLFVDCPSWKN